MPKPKSDQLFQLIKSLSKSEKRYLTLSLSSEGSAPTKSLRLLEAIHQQDTFDEDELLRQHGRSPAAQFANLKAHLYGKILQGLRAFHRHRIRDAPVREGIDHAQLLFDRGLYTQGIKQLRKAKKRARQNDNLELLLEILKIEKQLLAQGVAGFASSAVNDIIQQVQEVNTQINNINVLSNVQVRLNSWYAQTGLVRKAPQLQEVKDYMKQNLPDFEEARLSFREKISLYEVYVTYYQFVQDFAQAHAYAQRWVAQFEERPELMTREAITYIRGIHKLLTIQNKLRHHQSYQANVAKLRAVYELPNVVQNENTRAMLFKYVTIHEMNGHFLTGDFSGGVRLVRQIEADLDELVDKLGKHATIIMYYKIACMYFGASQHRLANQWLQRIINDRQVDLREDVHCFARMLNLISHYELGNTDVIDAYVRSTYRFLLMKDDLGLYQKYILDFLKNLDRDTTEAELTVRFQNYARSCCRWRNGRTRSERSSTLISSLG